jgi:hypothetical protein
MNRLLRHNTLDIRGSFQLHSLVLEEARAAKQPTIAWQLYQIMKS